MLTAQNNGAIKGMVVDATHQPLEKATIAIVSVTDSIVVTYSLTDNSGKFNLIKIPTAQKLMVHITHVSSSPYSREINLKPNETLALDTVVMAGVSLDEVVVTQVAPVRLIGDTLEFKADYFKTRPNANVEELLQLLPGLQVNVDGSIYYQGKQVSGIRVNNKDFFSHDLTIATRNLDASLIDAVQVVKDKGESKREILDDTDLPIIINLKTKKEFVKANFGKFYASGGSRDRYESGALVNTFRDTLQISFIGYANNLSRQGFNYSELGQYGGMNRAENNSYSYMNYGGLQNKISIGINANYDIAKKLKANLMYTFEQQNDYVDNKGTNSNFYESVTEIANNHHNATFKNYNHSVRAFARYKPDTTATVSMDVNMAFRRNLNDNHGNSHRHRDEGTQVQESENNSNSSSGNRNFRYNFYAEKKLPTSKILLSFRQNTNIQQSENTNNRSSFNRYYLFNDSTVNQGILQLTSGNNRSIRNTLNIQIPIGELLNWDAYARYDWELDRNIEEIDSKINTDTYSSRNDVANNKQGRFNFLYIGTRANASLFKKKLRITVGIEQLDLSRNYHYYGKVADLDDRHRYWLPHVSLRYAGLQLSYNKQVRLPSFYRIVAVNSDLYPTSLTIASPYFNNQLEQTGRISYYKRFANAHLNFNANVNYTVYDSSIGSNTSYDVSSSENTRTYYEAPGTARWYGYASINKRIVQNKTWNINWNVSGNGSTSESYSIVNGEENSTQRLYGNLNSSLTVTYKNNVTVLPTYGFGFNKSKNQRQTANFRDIENVNHSIGGMLRLDNIRKFRLETSYTVRNQPRSLGNDRTNLHLINASLYYPIMQRKGEVKLTAFDILNQNQSISMGGSGNSNYYSERLTLRQYFMLGLVYKFLATSE
ncbi:carboxypeptidase regulatory-like domain-containing protein [Parapedobacter sp. 10938]|uniref:carboxypeptidase regulatory-like domain-containing protein n=1 Tax=Parapedobacter flavus TaxID=3110225 RepID=UPI002DB98841|nr:carboxypeptidase regulatory-like domain-containing protein [Parapedobacter sp. 10938]MEC3878291.1 carboxypeptidase regulatory-like domain-containing protein [Parapedobacter sp. 10938]